MNFSLSKTAEHRVVPLGLEEEPLVVLDNAFANIDEIRREAESRSYGAIGPYYPGVRSALAADQQKALLQSVAPFLRDTFGADPDALDGESFYSMVTKAPAALDPIQRLPHYDGMERHRLAALLYLGEAKDGGTSFFRQRGTGFETITPDRFQAYKAALEAGVARHGLPSAGYVSDGGPLFDRTATVHAKPGRLVIYRGNLLHCSATPNNRTLPEDPKTGRLTLNAFFWRAQ